MHSTHFWQAKARWGTKHSPLFKNVWASEFQSIRTLGNSAKTMWTDYLPDSIYLYHLSPPPSRWISRMKSCGRCNKSISPNTGSQAKVRPCKLHGTLHKRTWTSCAASISKMRSGSQTRKKRRVLRTTDISIFALRSCAPKTPKMIARGLRGYSEIQKIWIPGLTKIWTCFSR